MHALDLPNLKHKPSKEELLDVLKKFEIKTLKNFESNNEPIDQKGLFNWLTRLIGSDLSWIEDEQDREWIIDLAGKRMAERCGRSAMPDMTREFEVEGLNEPIVLDEPALTEDNLGLKTWGSALILAKRLLKEPELLKDRVLELGSGTGLVAIACAKIGANIIATDLPAIVPNLQNNLEKNSISTKQAQAHILDWNDATSFNNEYGTFDTLIVADPVYSWDHPPLVSQTVGCLLKRDSNSHLILQLPQRKLYQDVRDFLYSKLESEGLKQLRFEIQEGVDEFGPTSYAWSLWKWI